MLVDLYGMDWFDLISMKGAEAFFDEIGSEPKDVVKDWKLASLSFGFGEMDLKEIPSNWKDSFRQFVPCLKKIGTVRWDASSGQKVEHWESLL